MLNGVVWTSLIRLLGADEPTRQKTRASWPTKWLPGGATSSARPARKPVTTPAIGPPASASAATTSSTRSGPAPPGKAIRSTTVSWKTTVTVTDVLVGEVWLGSGQSNMAMQLKGLHGQVDRADEEIAAANYPQIRMFVHDQGYNIYELMVQLLGEGKALLFYSSETEETAHLCHRVIVIREGRGLVELGREEADAEALVAASLREHARV